MASPFRTVFLGRVYPPQDPQASFSGKTVLVTGANTGLGFEAAAKFVNLGADRVILTSRSLEKGQTAKAEIAKRYGHEERIDVWQLDMNDYGSISTFAKQVNELHQLDVALLNAGVMMGKFSVSQYGWEETLQVNTLSTVLLALLLLPKLADAKTKDFTPVLDLVGSALYKSAAEKVLATYRQEGDVLKAFNTSDGFASMPQYGTSKLFLMYAFLELTRIVDSTRVHIVVTEPGPCRSNLARNFESPLVKYILAPMFGMILRSSEQGARTLVSGTLLGRAGHGGVWQHDQLQPLGDILTSEEGKKLQEKVWTEILQALATDWPGLDGLVNKLHSN